MGKVTYLIGAGASRKCLPVVKEMPDRLEAFRDFIIEHRLNKGESFGNLGAGTSTEVDAEENFIKECRDLIDATKKHASIDTYAKKLFLTQNIRKLKSLKAIVCCYFIYAQLTKDEDSRYDAFLASILKESIIPPDNIRIVTWNYDFQFEKAYSKYSLTDNLENNQQSLRIYPSKRRRIEHYKDGCGIFKLNGTTGFFWSLKNDHWNLFDESRNQSVEELVDHFMWYYIGVTETKSVRPLLNFAWEQSLSVTESTIVGTACKAITDSDAIVVIGYSFPFFNRDIDKLILKYAASIDSLVDREPATIYIQDIDPQGIINKLSSVLPKRHNLSIVPIKIEGDNDQFYLPPEL